MNDAIPAATLILMREAAGGGPPQLLMIERASVMAFAAGAMVFPGGRIDPDDGIVAADPSLVGDTAPADPDDAAARVAAIRETIEEVGIAVGMEITPGGTAAIRDGIQAGRSFGALLREGGVTLDLSALVPFARWRPHLKETRIFDTRFYASIAPASAEFAVDGGETVSAVWRSAADILADADAGYRHIIFPTRRNLDRLALFNDFAALAANAAAHPPEAVTPWIEERDGERWLCIPEGIGYPVTAQRLQDARRG